MRVGGEDETLIDLGDEVFDVVLVEVLRDAERRVHCAGAAVVGVDAADHVAAVVDRVRLGVRGA